MIAKRLSAAFALAALLAACWSPSPNLFAQEPAPIGLDPPAVPAGSNPAAPSVLPSTDPATAPTEAAPSETPPVTEALDPAALPPSSSADPLPPQTAPSIPSLNPLTVPPGSVDPSTAPPTAPAASLPPSSAPLYPSSNPYSSFKDGLGASSRDPFGSLPTGGPDDPLAPNPSAASPPAGQKAEAPKLAAKFLLLESDWGKAKDRARASEIARSLTTGPYDLSDAGDSVLHQGNAAMFQRDGATQLVADLDSLGLVRQSLNVQPFELKGLEKEGLVALGAVTATFAAPFTLADGGGGSGSEAWNFLVVGQAYPANEGFSSTLPPAISAAKVWIIGWRTTEELRPATGDLSDATAEPSKPGERYVGFFVMSSDQSALVPLRLPGIEGLTILFAPTVEAPLVRPLGPSGPRITWQPLQLDASVDTAEVIRAYESSPASKTTPTIGPPPGVARATGSLSENQPKEGYTIHLRSAAAGDLIRLEQALRESDLSVDVLSVQYQGTGGQGTIEIQAPADSANKLYDLVKKTLPISTAQIGVHQLSARSASDPTDEDSRNALTVSWTAPDEAQIAKVEEAIRRHEGVDRIATQFDGKRATMKLAIRPGSQLQILKMLAEVMPGAEVDSSVQSVDPPRSDVGTPASGDSPPSGEDRQAIIVHLKYADAREAKKIVEALDPEGDVQLAADPRTNSLILSAPSKTKYLHVNQVLELLKRLDEPADEATPAEAAQRSVADRADRIAKLRADLDRVERQVKSAAAEARSLSGAERDGKVRTLRERVTEAFRLRLDLQQEEAAELRDRLAKIESNLERRRRVEGAVVDRRIDVLLDPALEWPDLSLDEATPATPSSIPRTPSATTSSAEPSDFGSSFAGGPSLNELASGDSFSAATTLAMAIARLNDELATLTRNGAPPDSELRLALIQRQLDLLRQEFDGRHQALEQELAAAKSKLRAAQSNWERLSTLRDTGAVAAEEADRAQAELETAQAELAQQEILLQQYERAKSGMPPATSPAASSMNDAASFIEALQAGGKPSDPPTTPTGTSASDKSSGATDAEAKMAPTVPPELIGTWRLNRYTAASAPEAKVTFTKWTFDETTLGMDTPGGDDRYEVVSSPDSPGTFQTYKFHEVPAGLALEGNVLRVRYVVEAEGDRLRVAFGGGAGPPDEVAPDQGVIYYEFDRISRGSRPATDGPTDDADAVTLPAESAVGP